MTVEIVTTNAEDPEKYQDGFRYLEKNGSRSLHALACYSGHSFQHLAQCITYDRSGKVDISDEILKRPRRRLVLDASDNIVGVSITCKMLEFGQELDFETYFIGETSTPELYQKILPFNLYGKGSFEIVTYLPEQRKIVEKEFPKFTSVHNWNVFSREKGEKVVPSTKMRLLGESDLDYVREINTQFPIEISPMRSLEFQNAGLPYKTYMLDDKGSKSIICIREYSPSTWIVHYLHQPEHGRVSDLVELLNSIASDLQNKNKQLIWRVRLQDQDRFEELMRRASFIPVNEENHYHYQRSS